MKNGAKIGIVQLKSMEHGAWSREQGAWSREQGAGSRTQGSKGSSEPEGLIFG
ncbi:MAG: hypothetical protein ABIQ02_06575 [Saprospiraceae bacterium]